LPAEKTGRTNRLIKEKSPYLLQHARNPVDWFPWGEEAFRRAREEDKPVFLSVGYSTCHWCHVMERECFEDAETAEALNRTFIPIKVDREERPDIDGIYMRVCQMLTGGGGWPLTVILTPEKEPFFAGTYFPKHGRFGRPGLLDVINHVAGLWKDNRSGLLRSAGRIISALKDSSPKALSKTPDESVLHKAFAQLRSRFDGRHGGFGGPPKFPTPHNLLFLLRYWNRTGKAEALEMATSTLKAMRRGGLFDQVGGGFHRYSTDRFWILPHFEKMLYDQALLAAAYVEGFQATKDALFRQTAEDIFRYVLRDLTSEEGGFFSAEDADSEGEEGRFYVWTWEEIQEALDRDEAILAAKVYHIREQGNYAEEATGEKSGRNILYPGRATETAAAELGLSPGQLSKTLALIRTKLLSVRSSRVRPLRDDKILTDWNGLMIAALAKGARALGRPAYASAADRALRFLLKACWDKKGGLLHRYREGEASIPAFADDYAFLCLGLLEIYESTHRALYLKTAMELMDDFVSGFWDREGAGFYLTRENGEDLPLRSLEIYDGALPSANSAALEVLLRLAGLTGDPRYADLAWKLAGRFFPQAEANPSAHTHLLSGLDFAFGPSHEVVICGPRGDSEAARLLARLHSLFLPRTVTHLLTADKISRDLAEAAPFTADMKPVENKATAFVCSGQACLKPVTEADKVLDLLRSDGYNSGIISAPGREKNGGDT
jgi:uncharacterized protein YyaL (SSP411 family)